MYRLYEAMIQNHAYLPNVSPHGHWIISIN